MRINEIEIPDTIDGKPTRNSLGKLIHPTIEGIRNFWRWFGDSKVVDSQGRPLVVYHGTNYDIEHFDFSQLGKSVNNPTTNFGFYFTSVSSGADHWSNRSVERRTSRASQTSMTVYLRIENYYELKAEDFHYYLQKARESTIRKHLEKWKKSGSDGLKILRENGEIWFVVFGSNQIKSAIGNNGNFSVSSNKITEIGFAHALGELSIPHSEIVAKSVKDGTIFGNPVRVFTSGESKLYFFEHENEIAALVLVDGNFVRAIKSFNGEKGLVFALVNYLVSIKNIKLKIDASEPLTDEGFRWLLKMVSDNSGIKVRDTSGEVVDPAKLRSEWTQSKNTMGTQSGPTGFTISESSEAWKTKLQMNEKRIIPFVYFNC